MNADRMGVVLEEGTHRVVLTHRARGLLAGLVLAALGAAGLGAALPRASAAARFDPPKRARASFARFRVEPPMSADKPGLSVFFPAYNDAGTIASLALVAHMTARTLTDDYEVIVVEDGSPDHTGELLDEMANALPLDEGRAPREEPRLRRGAADGVPDRLEGRRLLHGRGRAVRPARDGEALGGALARRSTS